MKTRYTGHSNIPYLNKTWTPNVQYRRAVEVMHVERIRQTGMLDD